MIELNLQVAFHPHDQLSHRVYKNDSVEAFCEVRPTALRRYQFRPAGGSQKGCSQNGYRHSVAHRYLEEEEEEEEKTLMCLQEEVCTIENTGMIDVSESRPGRTSVNRMGDD